ncbi:hypothetical protein ACFY1L_48745 [Streptomyces sp. NPDC001663]|uniref:hypothetical protein n=1 Tax=Streptomyces sp. NPDC001663 TaxID=3364597 RepID=UPI0036984C49
MRTTHSGRSGKPSGLSRTPFALAEPQRLVMPFMIAGAGDLLEAMPRRCSAHPALLTDILDLLRGSTLSARHTQKGWQAAWDEAAGILSARLRQAPASSSDLALRGPNRSC